MGFLDSILGELVRRETGFNATRLIRRIGSKRLLMMGGAALAGGMLAQQSKGSGFGSAMLGGSTGGGVTVAPPKKSASLPPIPGTSTAGSAQAASPGSAANLPPVPAPPPPLVAGAPPLPAEDVGDAEDVAEDPPSQELLYAIVRTMVSAALSDGELDATEKASIETHLDESGLTERQQAQIRRDLVVPAAPAELAGMLPEGEDPEVLLQFAVLVLRADGTLQESEQRWLESLAGLLGVDEDRRQALIKDLAADLFTDA